MGFIIPGGTGPEQLELAISAERAGWDGVFVWEGPYGVDPWGLLAAVAQQTEQVKLGTVLTPLPWRRPWKVASQVATSTSCPPVGRLSPLDWVPSLLTWRSRERNST